MFLVMAKINKTKNDFFEIHNCKRLAATKSEYLEEFIDVVSPEILQSYFD